MDEASSKNRNNRRTVRALLADDQAMFRESLAGLLTSRWGFDVVGQVPNGDGLVGLAREEKPDVVFTELITPIEKAKEGLRELLSVSPPPKVVVVSAREDPRLARELVGLGVSAYVPKSASLEYLLAAVRTVLSGPEGTTVSRVVSLGVYEGAKSVAENGPSKRELEILLLAARGLSNRQIASHLSLAETTVKRHLANLYPKLGVGSRGEAVRVALLEQWIDIQDITSSDSSDGHSD